MNIKRKLKRITIALLLVLTVGCSDNPMDTYVGYWLNETDFGALEIAGSDGDYTLRYVQTNWASRASGELELTISGGKLFWAPKRMGPRELVLTDGELTLVYEGHRYSRTTKNNVERIRAANNIK